MAIRQPDSEYNYQEHFGDSRLILLPIHESRIGEEGYEQMLRDAWHYAETYDKILVGVLEAYCAYENHPILGRIPVVPTGEAGSGKAPRPLALYNSREEAWRAVARGVAELLEPYRPFFQQGIQGSVFFDTEKSAWCFDKGRKDGVSAWHREVRLQAGPGSVDLPIKRVEAARTYFGRLAGFDPEPSEVFQASITHLPERRINFLAEDHAGNSRLIRELTEDENLQKHGVNWTKDIPGLDYVLHFTQTYCYLTRAFEDTNDNSFNIYLNPYRPLTKPISLDSGAGVIREFLKQVVNWEFLRRMEAPYSEQLSEDNLEITVYHNQGKEWEQLTPQEGWVSVPLWAKQQKGGEVYENTLRIRLANRSERPLYVSAFMLSYYFGSNLELTEEKQLELKPGEEALLYPRENGNIPATLANRTLVYNLPYELAEVKFLASPQPFSVGDFLIGDLPGPPGSLFREEEGYFMERARRADRIEPLKGEWIAPLLQLRLDNPTYNRPQPGLLDELLRRPDAEPFPRALYFESFHLAPRYELKQKIQRQEEEEAPLSEMVQSASQPYVHTPDGLVILEYQLQQLYPQLRDKAEKPILAALGDSWFNQAEPVDISHFLMEDFIVLHAPLQHWGQLEEAVYRLEKAIEGVPSVTLLLSPMGERLLDKLEEWVQPLAPDNTDDIRQALSDGLFRQLGELGKEWEKGLSFLSRFGSRLQVVAHGYDYFALEEFGGPALSQHPKEWRRNIIAFVVDVLNARLRATLQKIEAPNIHYLDLRKTLNPGDWAATLIPAPDGFRKLAGSASLFISRQYQWEEAPYVGTEYFLWQMALMEGTSEAYMDLVEAYPEGAHRAWAEERIRALHTEGFYQVQSQSLEPEPAQPPEPETLLSLRRRANELISTNKLGELFELLERELKPDAAPGERLAVYRKEFDQLEKQRRRYKRPSKKMDRDMASLADAVGELAEELSPEDLRNGGRREA